MFAWTNPPAESWFPCSACETQRMLLGMSLRLKLARLKLRANYKQCWLPKQLYSVHCASIDH